MVWACSLRRHLRWQRIVNLRRPTQRPGERLLNRRLCRNPRPLPPIPPERGVEVSMQSNCTLLRRMRKSFTHNCCSSCSLVAMRTAVHGADVVGDSEVTEVAEGLSLPGRTMEVASSPRLPPSRSSHPRILSALVGVNHGLVEVGHRFVPISRRLQSADWHPAPHHSPRK